MEWFVALRYLRGKRRFGFVSLRSYISAGGVFLGSMVLVIALSVANGFEKEVRDRIVGTVAHAKLLKYHGRPIASSDSLVHVLEQHPQVLGAAPFIEGKGGIEHDETTEGVLIMGVDASRERRVTSLSETIVSGEMDLDSTESARGRTFPGIIIGLGLADRLGVRPGHEVVLMALTSTSGMDPTPRYERYTVSGLFETGYYEYDMNLIYISIESAQSLLGVGGVDGIQFKTADLFRAGAIAKDVLDYVGGYPYWAVGWREQNKSLFDWMRLEKIIIFFVISLIIVVAAFNIISSLIMMIMEKRREIGVLMGLGAKTGAIMRIFMFNGIATGFIGSTVGTVAGLTLCYIQHRWQLIPLPGDIYFIDTLPVLIRPLDAASVYITANVICWLATLHPAWKASKILPAESIRFE